MIDFTNKVATRITLYADISHRNNPAYVYAKQNDADSRYLIVDVVGLSGDIAVDGMAQLNATKPDGTHSYIAGTIEQDGTIVVGLTDQLLAVVGLVHCDVSIFDKSGSSVLTTSTFYIVVESSNYDSHAIESEDEFNGVALQAANDARASAVNANTAADRADAAAATATADATAEVTRLVREIGVVQEFGDSTMAVVSQVATTKRFDFVDSKISRNAKRIDNLVAGLPPEDFTEDNSVAYIKDVPEGALPYAEVKKVGGMTRKCTQIWDEQLANGYYSTDDGSFTAESSFFASKNKIGVLPNTAYSMTCPAQRRIVFFDINQNYLSGKEYNSDPVITTPLDCYFMAFSLWSSYGTEYKNDIMINSGSVALPYEPYFDGLRSAPVTEVESVGVNLIPYPYSETTKTVNGVTFTDNGDGSVTVKGTATGGNASFNLANNLEMRSGTYYISGDSADIRAYVTKQSGNIEYIGKGLNIFSEPIRLTLYIVVLDGETVNYTVQPMFNRGITALPYTPYRDPVSLPIPATVQALDGYGWGVNDKIYNYIDWEKKQFVKRVDRVDLGTADWIEITVGGTLYFYKNVTSAKASTDFTLIADYEKTDGAPTDRHYSFGWPYLGEKCVCVRDDAYTDAATFKAAMSGVMLVYELAESIVTDISDLITADNLICVEGGGTLTFDNEYGYAVPSEVEYQVEV